MKRIPHVLLAAALLGVTAWFAAPASYSADSKGKAKKPPAGTDNPDTEGRWSKYKVGQSRRYVVWHDTAGWHVRTTTAGSKISFNGTLKVFDGVLTSVTVPVKLEGSVKNIKDADLGAWSNDRKQFDFKLVTTGKEDGFDFTVSKKATQVQFTMRVDGADQPEVIFIGPNGEHPKSAIFTLPAHPASK